MSQNLDQLLLSMQKPQSITAQVGEERIEVSKPAQRAGTLYEKVRTSIDYQEEHLLRRNAILRMLKRFIGSDISQEKMAENLLRELVWAKYLPNKEVPVGLAQELVPIFEKYDPLFQASESSVVKEKAFHFVLDIMSTELEYAITPPYREEALVSYMYAEMQKRIHWDDALVLSAEDKDLLLYIAIHRTLLRSNPATLRFRVFTLYYPDWPGASSAKRIGEMAKNLDTIIQAVDSKIDHTVTQKLSVLLRRRSGVFRVIRDVIEDGDEDAFKIIHDPEALDRAVGKALKIRTKAFRKKLRRTVLRAVAFLFITKMLLALILELPYDLLVLDEVHFYPLATNILFPPFLLAFIGLTVGIPEKRNTEDYRGAIRALVVGADHDLLNVRMKRDAFSAWAAIYHFFYTISFLVVFGFIASVLFKANFNWLSVTLFLFFLSLVTFFGIRIRMSTREVVLSNQRRGVIGTLFDVITLPIVRAGRWLSEKVAKINVFIYFFDFIVEAPLKVAIRFSERWMDYISEKREEI
jgi:hypothetical protein